ncbi:MAG: DUF4097 family beta strand repeat protein [Acidobacteria bacterium]|nr:DUF4097 family beta strand repeat protein [Acidobacteriota bacterium]MBV9483587.1 DUF4097 family beta strand repeat protein [Acidobacteriota bacterium]
MLRRLASTLLIFFAAFCSYARAEEWRKTYSIVGKPEMRVETNDAEIRVSAGDLKNVEAVVTAQGYKIGSGGVTITEHQVGDRIELNLHTPSFHVFPFGLHKSVRVELNVPRDSDLDLHSGDGNITVENVSGTIMLRSGDGAIRVNAGKGSFHIETGDGRVECRSIEGELRAETKDGAVQIDGLFTALDLHTGDGSIDAEARPGSRMLSPWSVRTGDGNVNLGLPDGFSADVDVHTGDGHITLDFPVTVESGASLRQNAIRGKINGGGELLEIKTGDGNIRLRRA